MVGRCGTGGSESRARLLVIYQEELRTIIWAHLIKIFGIYSFVINICDWDLMHEVGMRDHNAY